MGGSLVRSFLMSLKWLFPEEQEKSSHMHVFLRRYVFFQKIVDLMWTRNTLRPFISKISFP